MPTVLSAARETPADHARHVRDRRLRAQDRLDTLDDRERARLHGARRQLDHHLQLPLVLGRQEAARHHPVQQPACDHERRVHCHDHAGAAHGEHGDAAITRFDACEGRTEPVGQTRADAASPRAAGSAIVSRDRLQQVRAQRGRERQRHERRHQHRCDHRHRELPVDAADGAWKKRHRHEYGGQHRGHADDRTADPLHCAARGVARRHALLHHPVHALDDDDRVVDEDADRQHETEHREHVDRQSERPHRDERAHQRDGNHDGRHQRVTQIAQEQPHHAEHQHDRLDERQHNLPDRDRHEMRTVERNLDRHAWRQHPRQLGEPRTDRVRRFERVAARAELDADRGRRPAVQPRIERVVVAAEFDARDVGDAHRRTVRLRLQHDPAELVRRRELPLDDDRRGELLAARERRIADRAGRHRRVLRADRRDHVVGADTVFAQLVRIEPDPQRLVGVPQFGRADARRTLQFAQHVAVQVIAELRGIARAVGRRQRDEHQERVRRLEYADPLLDDLLRQP